ncbi:hypothetical protein LXL04_021032 [Taraxacum kok-saghyz]
MPMIGSLVRFGRRQLHTIISREIIKPSSPTPSHLKTYNLSLLDQIMPNIFMPLVTFYPKTAKYGDHKTLDLKKSLSQTLTKYYPFAGRLSNMAPSSVDCIDHGVEFLEASIDTTLSDFLQHSHRHGLDQFFPHGLVHYKSTYDLQRDQVTPLEVQVNHFQCGGVAVAVSLSHKIADGSSLAHFMNDWAKMTRLFSKEQKDNVFSINPKFMDFQYMKINPLEYKLESSDACVTKSFLFPNSKINVLKLKVAEESGQPITSLTRVEVLTWLLYKCAVSAATKNSSGSFKPTGIRQIINLRSKMEKLTKDTIGNFALPMEVLTKNESEMNPGLVISEMKKQKMQFRALNDMETVFGILSKSDLKEELRKVADVYACSSFCGYPAYEVDFGWGKPVKATLAGDLHKNSFVLFDAPNMDGIEALVCLGKDDMAIVESDPELL